MQRYNITELLSKSQEELNSIAEELSMKLGDYADKQALIYGIHRGDPDGQAQLRAPQEPNQI